MPLGLRAAEAAMQALGVQHAPDGQLTALVEIDRNHCSTCFADGVQVVTGCTFGKGNIRSLGYSKLALTPIDNKTGRSIFYHLNTDKVEDAMNVLHPIYPSTTSTQDRNNSHV